MACNGALDIQQFWASGGRTREPIMMNLVYNCKFGQQCQSRDQILIFFKFKMADGRCCKIFEIPMDRLGRNVGGRIPSCSQY